MNPKIVLIIALSFLQSKASQTDQFKKDLVVTQRPQVVYVWQKQWVNFPYDDQKPYRYCYIMVKKVYRA